VARTCECSWCVSWVDSLFLSLDGDCSSRAEWWSPANLTQGVGTDTQEQAKHFRTHRNKSQSDLNTIFLSFDFSLINPSVSSASITIMKN
jgi:hypothetical protein